MATRNYLARIIVAFIGIGLLSPAFSKNAFAHCDMLGLEWDRCKPIN
ncbi:MAG: hypothetical protein ABFS18_04810 [Thermodesulfobacteriota bacterium]